MFALQPRYRQAPAYRTQNKSRAREGAPPSASFCKQKVGGFWLER